MTDFIHILCLYHVPWNVFSVGMRLFPLVGKAAHLEEEASIAIHLIADC